MIFSSAGVEFFTESAPDDDGLVFEWWGVLMNLPWLSLSLGINEHDF